jgi:hypothetical protein
MAHKGKLYPLSPHRFINADVDYPLWAGNTYECFLPTAGGALGTSLTGRRFRTDAGFLDPPWVIWKDTSTDPAIGVLYILQIMAQLTNDPGFPMKQRFQLDYIQAIPPAGGTLAIWEWDWPVGAQLDLLAAISVTILDPLIYDPDSTIVAHAETW